jgi:hypothetical protein
MWAKDTRKVPGKLLLTGALAAFLTGTAASAQEAEPVTPKLTPKLRQLLQQEMQAVLGASQEILDALVIGDHTVVADRARQIYDSFILEQSLTEQDRQDLMAAVPTEFVQLDRSFHEQAAHLAEAARAEDHVLQARTFGELVESCVACHSRFATDIFP